MDVKEVLREYLYNEERNMDEKFLNYIKDNSYLFIDILFECFYEEMNKTTSKSFFFYDNFLYYFNLSKRLNLNIERKYLMDKIIELINYVEDKKINNLGKTKEERKDFKRLTFLSRGLNKINNELKQKEITAYQFIDYLIEKTRNLDYLEITFKEMPSLLRARDEDDVSLLPKIVKRNLLSIDEDDAEKTLYYNNLIALILAQDNFSFTDELRKECLEAINDYLDELYFSQRSLKLMKKKVEAVANLRKLINPPKKDSLLEELATSYNIPLNFSEEILRTVRMKKIPNIAMFYPDRIFIDDYLITIDGDDALEIDDALSCKKLKNGNYLYGIHIASVLGYFLYDSEVVEEALARTTAIYLPSRYQDVTDDFHKTIPMFPYEFSANKGSLKENGWRLARSYYYEIDSKTGDVVNQKFFKSVIKNRKRTTYNEINEVLEKGSADKELENLCNDLQKVTDLIYKNYHPKALYQELKQETDDIAKLRLSNVGAERIVYTAMTMNGNKVASFFADPKRGYPCLYRVHKVSHELTKEIEKMIKQLPKSPDSLEYKAVFKLIKAMYPKASYDIEGEHHGLGFEHYCHCTSCLRRAADIVVEHALEVCYDKRPTDYQLKKLDAEIRKRIIQINSKVNTNELFVSEYAKRYFKEYHN